MNEKYSNWLKIDLHIHTNLSKKTKEGDYKGDFLVNTAKEKLKENNVKIFSFTDHNIINIQAYENYYESCTDDDPLLLLGIELDVLVTKGKKNRTYHTLLIFNCNNINNIKEISEELENKYRTKGITDSKKRVLTIEEIVELFPKQDYFFIPHAYSDKSIVTAHRDGLVKDAQKMVLLMECALEKVTKQETIANYNNGFNTLLSRNFRSKEDIPYINFSDNHCINNYPCRHKGENNIGNHEFYYIKGLKCYESIRLAFIDPESRIKTTREYNEIEHTNNTIDILQIKDNSIIKNIDLRFSPHLNVIIGGRSSGKSLLLWILGKKIDSLDLENKYDKIELKDIKIQSRQDAQLKDLTSLQQNYIYIKQGDIINYFESGELKDLAKKSNKQPEYSEALEEFNNYVLALKDVQRNLISAYEKVYDLGTSSEHILHNKTIESILSNSYIFRFETNTSIKREDKSVPLENTKEILNRINKDIDSLSKFKILDLTKTEDKIIDDFKEFIKNKIQLIKKKHNINAKKVAFINSVDNIIKDANNTLDVKGKQKEISSKSLTTLKDDIKEKFLRLKNLKQHSYAFENYNSSFKQSIEIDNDINLILETPKKYILKNEFLEGINKSSLDQSIYINILQLLNLKATIKNLGGNIPNNLSKKLDTQLKSCVYGIKNPKDYLMYKDGETSKEKSPGYNSEKYLEIILKNSLSKTIFIDQPEDNLGNRFISDGLVQIIRDIKFKKQIFLVTHNPSIVVYGDAESIILAKNEDNIISYEQIVLENHEAQKEICNILDGGEYIFNNRSKKYNIQRILKNK